MTDAALSVRGLTLFREGHRVLDNVTFELQPGKIVAVTGRSGSGKSLLLRALAGLDARDEGYITVEGTATSGLDEAHWNLVRRKIGLVLEQSALLHDLTLAENLAFPLVQAGANARDVEGKLEHSLVSFNLHPWRDAEVSQLSPTQIKRALLARALVLEPRILLLDAPFDGLDPDARDELAGDLERLVRRQGVALLLTCHDATGLEKFADSVFNLERGLLARVR